MPTVSITSEKRSYCLNVLLLPSCALWPRYIPLARGLGTFRVGELFVIPRLCELPAREREQKKKKEEVGGGE